LGFALKILKLSIAFKNPLVKFFTSKTLTAHFTSRLSDGFLFFLFFSLSKKYRGSEA
jgi:hypothetical protein